jgi:recombination protein RecT
MAANLVAKNPKIAECSAASVLGAVMEAAILGFRPVAGLGQCYFVPYGGHVQFQIGYRGWIELARRSGKVKTLYAHCVHEGDNFEYELGLEPKLKHVPGKGGKMTHVYAVAHYTDGGFNFTVLSRDEVEGLRTRNASQRGAPSGPWATDYEEMAKAKAIKRLSKYMPLTDEVAKAAAIDEGFIPESGAISQDGSGLDVDAVEWEIVPENTDENAE